MSAGEAMVETPIDWGVVIDAGNPGARDNPDYVARCEQFAEPYMEIVAANPEFEELFTGIPPEVAVSFLCVDNIGTGHYLAYAHDQDPAVINRLALNRTACLIAGSYAANEPISRSERQGGKPSKATEDDIANFGKTLLIKRGLDYVSLSNEDILEIADHSMPELLTAIGHDWAITELPSQVALMDPIIADPSLATKLCRAVLETKETLSDTVYRMRSRVSQAYLLASSEVLQKKLFRDPNFQDPAFRLLESVVGRNFVSGGLYDSAQSRLEAGESADSIGQDLRERLTAMGKLVVAPEFLQEQAGYGSEDNELLRSLLSWQKFDFGQGTLKGLVKVIKDLRTLPPDMLRSNYRPSGLVDIARSEKQEIKFTEDMEARYWKLYHAHASFWMALEERRIDHATGQTIDFIQADLASLAERVGARLETADGPTAEKISFQLDQLRQAQEYDYAEFPRGIATLARYKNHFEEHLITLLMAEAQIPFNLNAYQEVREPGNGDALKALSEIIENILHNGVSELLEAHPDLDKKDIRAIKDLLNVRAFDPLFKEAAASDKPPVKLNFVPARGLLLEASGHIGHTCWAENGIISQDRPNIDSVVFVHQEEGRDDGRTTESFMGAALLIRTTGKGERPLLIIRGLNPSLTLLDKVSVSDFYDRFTAYVQSVAAEEGREAAIVIDNQAGQAATNRPALFKLLESSRQSLERIPVPNDETFFNDYDISDNTYLLPPAEVTGSPI
jgi:hypothetical protein